MTDEARDAAGQYVEEWARDLVLRPANTVGPPICTCNSGTAGPLGCAAHYARREAS